MPNFTDDYQRIENLDNFHDFIIFLEDNDLTSYATHEENLVIFQKLLQTFIKIGESTELVVNLANFLYSKVNSKF